MIAQSENEAEKVIRKAGVQIHTLTAGERGRYSSRPPNRCGKTFARKSGPLGKKLIDLGLGLK